MNLERLNENGRLFDDIDNDVTEYIPYLSDDSEWYGTDVNKEISLCEYHLLIRNRDNENNWFDVVYLSSNGGTHYTQNVFSIDDICDLLEGEHRKSFCSYADYNSDTLLEEAKENPSAFLYSIWSYDGLDNY